MLYSEAEFLIPLDRYLNICAKHFILSCSEIVEIITWALVHYSHLSEENRNKIIETEVFKSILEIARADNTEITNDVRTMEHVYRLLNNVVSPSYTLPPRELVFDIITIAVNTVNTKSNDLILLTLAVKCLSNIASPSVDELELAIINTGVIDRILKMIPHTKELQHTIIVLIGNVLSIDSTVEINKLIDKGVIDYFNEIYKITKLKVVRRMIIWAVSNIAAGNQHHILALTNSELFKRMMEGLFDSEFSIRNEVVSLLKNVLSLGDIEVVVSLIANGSLEKIINKLKDKNDKEITVEILYRVNDILNVSRSLEEALGDSFIKSEVERMNGVGIIQELTLHENIETSNIAQVILENFYNVQQVS
jgi:hypothetical protein